MSETPMVEAVARAIVAAPNLFVEGVDQEPNHCALEQARAAIQAMRGASKAMIMAGNDGIDDDIDRWNYDSGSGYSIEPQAAYNVWQRMIDAALAVPEEGREP